MQTQKNIAAIITLIIGIGVATLCLIFVGVLGGQTYQLNEHNINQVGTATQGNPSHAAIRMTYDTQVTHKQWFTVHDAFTNGTISFYANSTSLTQNKFNIHAGNHTVRMVDATYNKTDVILHYKYDNATMRTYIKEGAISAFAALEETGGYLPIIVLAVIIIIVLGMIMGMAGFKKPGESSGGAL